MKSMLSGPYPLHYAPLPRGMNRGLNSLLRQNPVIDAHAALDALVDPTRRALLAHRAPHAIVVLGAPAHEDGSLSAALSVRVTRAAELAAQYPDAFVVLTGGSVANRTNEARSMASELERLGVPDARLLIEPRARITVENVLFSFALLRQTWGQDPTSLAHITLVTEPFHGPRSLRLFDKLGKTFGEHHVLHFAPSAPSVSRDPSVRPWLSIDGTIRLHAGFHRALEACIEEQRRIIAGF